MIIEARFLREPLLFVFSLLPHERTDESTVESCHEILHICFLHSVKVQPSLTKSGRCEKEGRSPRKRREGGTMFLALPSLFFQTATVEALASSTCFEMNANLFLSMIFSSCKVGMGGLPSKLSLPTCPSLILAAFLKLKMLWTVKHSSNFFSLNAALRAPLRCAIFLSKEKRHSFLMI
jgi:hypothetical protein